MEKELMGLLERIFGKQGKDERSKSPPSGTKDPETDPVKLMLRPAVPVILSSEQEAKAAGEFRVSGLEEKANFPGMLGKLVVTQELIPAREEDVLNYSLKLENTWPFGSVTVAISFEEFPNFLEDLGEEEAVISDIQSGSQKLFFRRFRLRGDLIPEDQARPGKDMAMRTITRFGEQGRSEIFLKNLTETTLVDLVVTPSRRKGYRAAPEKGEMDVFYPGEEKVLNFEFVEEKADK